MPEFPPNHVEFPGTPLALISGLVKHLDAIESKIDKIDAQLDRMDALLGRLQ